MDNAGLKGLLCADNHLIVPGRFRAHAHQASTSKHQNSPTAANPEDRRNGRSKSSETGYRRSDPGRAGSAEAPSPSTPRRRRRPSQRFQDGRNGLKNNERTWLLRPSRDRVEVWLDSWWNRWLILVIIPSIIVSRVSKAFKRPRAEGIVY